MANKIITIWIMSTDFLFSFVDSNVVFIASFMTAGGKCRRNCELSNNGDKEDINVELFTIFLIVFEISEWANVKYLSEYIRKESDIMRQWLGDSRFVLHTTFKIKKEIF